MKIKVSIETLQTIIEQAWYRFHKKFFLVQSTVYAVNGNQDRKSSKKYGGTFVREPLLFCGIW